MLYQLEYLPASNCLVIHLDKRVTKKGIEDFEGEDDHKEEQPVFVRDIFSMVEGISGITLKSYEIILEKGVVFDWNERMIKKILFMLETHLDLTGERKEKDSPITSADGMNLSESEKEEPNTRSRI